MTVRRLVLIRHGQSTWNAEQRWQGQADPPLSELGERQARAAGAAVVHLRCSGIVSSDLVRARRTAELLAPADLEVTLEPALRERHAGEWTGLTRAEIDERYPGDVEAQRSPPGFEGDEPLLARVWPALEAVMDTIPAGGAALVITHGGVIRTVERHLGAPAASVPNLGGRWVHVDGVGFRLGDRELLIDPDDGNLTIPHQL